MKQICMDCTEEFSGHDLDQCPNCQSVSVLRFSQGKSFKCFNCLANENRSLALEDIIKACETFFFVGDKFTGTHKIFLIEGNHNLNYFKKLKKMGFSLKNNTNLAGEKSLSIDYEVQ